MKKEKQYGNLTLKDIEKKCSDFAAENNKTFFVSINIEGELVDKIQNSSNQDGLIINAEDTFCISIIRLLKILKIPVNELHINKILWQNSDIILLAMLLN